MNEKILAINDMSNVECVNEIREELLIMNIDNNEELFELAKQKGIL